MIAAASPGRPAGRRRRGTVIDRRSLAAFLTLASLFAPGVVAAGSAPRRLGPEPALSDRDRAERLIVEGRALADQWTFAPALEKLERALSISEKLGDRTLIAACLNDLANVSDAQGHADLGWSRHQEALSIAREIRDHRLEAIVLADIGMAFWRRAEYGEAMGRLEEALRIQGSIGDVSGRARTLDLIGRVHFKQGSYDEAIASERLALSLQEAAGDREGRADTLEDLGDVHLDRHAYALAIESYERSLRLREETGDRWGQIYLLNDIGVTYLFQGAPGAAMERFRRALALAVEIESPTGRASSLNHMGSVYSRLGRHEKAMECFEEAVSLHVEIGDRRAQAWDLSHLAGVTFKGGNAREAARAYRRAIAVREEIEDRRGLLGDIEDLADVYESLGDDAHALRQRLRALEIGEEIRSPYVPATLGKLGRTCARRGEPERALMYARRAVDEAARLDNPQMRWVAEHALGVVQRTLGRRQDALVAFRNSLSIIERIRSGVSREDESKAGFLEDKQIVYADTVTLLAELGRSEEALETAERARSRAFLDLLAGRDVVSRPADVELLLRIGRLEEDLRRGEAVSGGSAPASVSVLREQESARAALAELHERHPELASLVTMRPPSLASIREEARRRRATIIEYFVAEDRIVIWVVLPDGAVRSTSSRAARADLESSIEEMRRTMGAASTRRAWDEIEIAPAALPSDVAGPHAVRSLRRLHEWLVEPIEPFLPSSPDDVVTIVPHGALFLVSFGALRDREGRYLIERHTLAYSPAVSVLPYTESKKRLVAHSEAPRVLLVGNPSMPVLPGRSAPLPPLPGAESETAAVGRLYRPERLTSLTGARATERTVRDLAPGETILHLATHGIVRDDEPLESFLAFAPGLSRPGDGPGAAEEDGRLTAEEIFGLDLHADLVVLSACNTGLGKILGDGVIGLSRAFIYAGTPSVMVSLWRVADSTASFEMERFHAALSAGSGKAAALRRAQIETIEALRRGSLRTASGAALPEHPVFWAPFVLIGEP